MESQNKPPEFLCRYLNDSSYRAHSSAEHIPNRDKYPWEVLNLITIPVADIHDQFGEGCGLCGKYGCDCRKAEDS